MHPCRRISEELPTTVPKLIGPRVQLRVFREDDEAAVREASRDPLITLITTLPADSNTDDALAYIHLNQ